MPITRRKFLKHLAFSVAACGIAPAAVAKALAPPIPGAQWVWIDVIEPLKANGIDGNSRLDEVEERLTFKKMRVNPIYAGKIGVYDGSTIHIR